MSNEQEKINQWFRKTAGQQDVLQPPPLDPPLLPVLGAGVTGASWPQRYAARGRCYHGRRDHQEHGART